MRNKVRSAHSDKNERETTQRGGLHKWTSLVQILITNGQK